MIPKGPSEASKYRHLTKHYCIGNGIDVGSGGDPVVPHAIQVDLPKSEYDHYHSADGSNNHVIQWRGYADKLPFKDGTLDWVFSSHLLEDFLDWRPLLKEWSRVLKRNGKLIILIPERKLWSAAISRGQLPNCSHKHEGSVGELSSYADEFGWKVVRDSLTALTPEDYTIMFVAIKK